MQPIMDEAPAAWSAPVTETPWPAAEAAAPESQPWSAEFHTQSGPNSTTSIEQEFGMRCSPNFSLNQ